MSGDLPFDAEPIGPAHTGDLRRAFEAASKRAWCYFAPFLCCYSLPPGREVLSAEFEGALWLVVRRQTEAGPRMDLMVPPLPLRPETLAPVLDAMASANGGVRPRILWVDEEDAGRLAAGRFSLRPKDPEYLYDPARVAAASGREFRDLRKRLRRFERAGGGRFRELAPGDIPACHVLLKHWRRRQGRRHGFLLDWGYTRAALDRYGAWDRADLSGWCVEVDGRLTAFAMAGRMQEDLANFFIAKADPEVPGLSEYLRWAVCRALSAYRLVNDASDLGLPGLRQHKRKLRPVGFLNVYTAEVLMEADV